jgi:hypothetical protein
MHIAVILNEGVLHLVEESLLGLELLLVEEVDEIISGRKDIDYANAQADH